MPWVKATDKYSKGWQLCRIIGDTNKFPAKLASQVIADSSGKTYRKDQIEWLDTEEPSFTVNDLLLVWHKSSEITIDNTSYDVNAESVEADYGYIEKEKNEFFKKQFGIDVN